MLGIALNYKCSDDRTLATVKPKIIDAIQMKSLFGTNKPNLIILDEIDGVANVKGGEQVYVC